MTKNIKEDIKKSSVYFSQKKYDFVQYLQEELEEAQELNECIDFDDYSR